MSLCSPCHTLASRTKPDTRRFPGIEMAVHRGLPSLRGVDVGCLYSSLQAGNGATKMGQALLAVACVARVAILCRNLGWHHVL